MYLIKTCKERLSLGVTEYFILSQLAKTKAWDSSFKISIIYPTLTDIFGKMFAIVTLVHIFGTWGLE